MAKRIAIYGVYEAKVPVRQRYWKKIRRRYWKWVYHRKGPEAGQRWYKRRRWKTARQRVWKTTKRMKKAVFKGRYEFHGTGRDLYRAIILAHRYMPKGYVDVSAVEFIEHPQEYGVEGHWIERKIESP